MTSAWTVELRELVFSLWPTHSAKQIVQKLPRGFTRNSVMGLVHRAGMTIENKKYVHPLTGIRGQKLVSVPRVRVKSPPREKLPNPVEQHVIYRLISANGNSSALRVLQTVEGLQRPLKCVEITPLGLTFDQLERGMCRYPDGDNLPYTFCGHPIMPGFSYCVPHKNLAWKKPSAPVRPYWDSARAPVKFMRGVMA